MYLYTFEILELKYFPCDSDNLNSAYTLCGTSMDGIDLSIINSDGENNTSIVDNFFFEYSSDFKLELINIRKEILQKNDLISKKPIINDLSRKITLLHVEAINKILKKNPLTKLDLIGYHGHTLIHKPEQAFTFQLGCQNSYRKYQP